MGTPLQIVHIKVSLNRIFRAIGTLVLDVTERTLESMSLIDATSAKVSLMSSKVPSRWRFLESEHFIFLDAVGRGH